MNRKSIMKCLLIVLTMALLFALSACSGKNDTALPTAEEKVQQMLECQKQGDAAGAYALLYPGIVDLETYTGVFQQICEYCPLTDGFTTERTGYDVFNRVGSSPKAIVNLSYTLVNDGTEYLISAAYQTDSEGEGFTRFQLISRADYDAAANQSGTASK